MAAPVIGFHASHEQFRPDRLLRLVQAAEAAGFDAAMCSDHWAPWSEEQGESGFAWSWLGAALQATSMPFGVVNAPGQRYHPAIIAQAADNSVMTALAHPSQISAAGVHVNPADLDGAVRISADLGRHVDWLQRDLSRGFDAVYLHEVGPGQEGFVEAFGREVLPRLRERDG